MKNLLILYNEVMPYNVAAYKALVRLRSDVEVDIFSWNADKKLTPYEPPVLDRVHYNEEKKYSLQDLIALNKIKKYRVVYICGRSETKYLDFALYIRKHCKGTIVIGQTDEQYYGNLKQFVVKVLFRFLYKRYFHKIFVPGYFQYEYVRYMGFKKSEILIGSYTANIEPFNEYYLDNQFAQKRKNKDVRLLYLGRLEKEKGLIGLLEIINELNASQGLNIVVTVVGNGSLLESIKNYPFVNHYKFADQETIITLLPDVDFFVLPSVYEPWGVVIHEMAAAGMPIICSEECGARSAMVINNYNGFIFKSNNPASLKQVLLNAYHLSEQRRTIFKKRSYELSKCVTPDLWAETISSFMN